MNQYFETEAIVAYYSGKIIQHKLTIKKYIYSLLAYTLLILCVYFSLANSIDKYSYGFNDRLYLIIGLSLSVLVLFMLITTYYIGNIIILKRHILHCEEQNVLISHSRTTEIIK